MSKINELVEVYQRHVSLKWSQMLSRQEKVWFCVYDPQNERRLRKRIKEFEIVTEKAGHTWELIDVTDLFEQWMSEVDYRDEYFQNPELLKYELDSFICFFSNHIQERLRISDEKSVTAIVGIGSLFGIIRVSQIIEDVVSKFDIDGRLLFFFPGERDGSNYRLLKARDGWNYLATPIEVQES